MPTVSIETDYFISFIVILLHAATRKRNIKNKFANVVEVFKEDVSPMTIILSKICTIEQEQQDSGKHQNWRKTGNESSWAKTLW